ncbi:MFS transporter [Clostridium sp. SHJSY1]|uniref:MFS transporter n=1 Tax=Clostridium sp. SHJSY1 TaxID=2942483 RepID=UPI0028767DD4|nr:MFS transporter [Clostridium sp. SHJSY1]MDS0524801.1 MFS transporter [Clostridium sp. SHJSY1]
MNNEICTSFKKLMTGLIIGNVGFYIASIVPTALLLTLKFLELTPQDATINFSLTAAIGGIATLIAGYIGGMISDKTCIKFGKRKTWIILGSLIGSVGLCVIGYSTSVKVIVLLWVVCCIGFNFMYSALNGALADQCENEKRGTAGGLLGIFAPVGIQIGIGIMTFINNSSISTKFNVLAVIYVITSVICCTIIKDTPAEKKTTNNKIKKDKISFYPSLKKYPEFSWGVATRFFMAISYASQTYMTLYFVMHFNIPQNEVTQLVFINGIIGSVVGAVASIIAGSISDKFKKQKPILIASGFIVALGLILLVLANSIVMAIIACIFISSGYSAYLAVDMALTMRILPNMQEVAKDMSIVNTAGNLPNSIVPAFAPTLIGIGGFALLFSALAVCSVISAAAVLPIPEMITNFKGKLYS